MGAMNHTKKGSKSPTHKCMFSHLWQVHKKNKTIFCTNSKNFENEIYAHDITSKQLIASSFNP